MITDKLRRRGLVPGLLLLATALIFVWWIDRFDPPSQWLFFVYLRIWFYVALFLGASLVAGLRLVSLLFQEPPRLGERLVFGLSLGVLVFFFGVFLGGLLGLFGTVFFFGWPCLLLAFGGPAVWREARRMRTHLRRLGPRLFAPRSPIETVAAATLALGILAVYLQILAPANTSSDAVWYHLPIAEHYAASGKIRWFSEGWFQGVLPQLASVLYAWGFQSPGALFDHVVLASHIDFSLFVATLGGVSVLVRRLINRRAPYSAALFFAFPGFLVYDSNVNAGADHMLAFWAPALVLALIRLARRFLWREAVLAGALTAGALLTKYHGIYFLVPETLLLLGLAIRYRRLTPILICGATSLVAFSPHWLKNWIFYGDPLYPFLPRWFPSHPMHPGVSELAAQHYFAPQFTLTGTTTTKILETLKVLVTFSFVPHDWGFHGVRPIFGALFTCLLVTLPFVRARLRVWLVILGIHVGIAVWFVIQHQDRYLQALLPIMVASSAALLILLWRSGVAARAAAVGVVLLQFVYGADVYFIRSHGMIGDSPLKAMVDFLGAARGTALKDRLRLWGDLQNNSVAKKVPRGSTVLIHAWTEKLGVGVPSVIDTVGWQGAIDYVGLSSPAATFRLWRKLGVTHTWWWPSMPPMSMDQVAREAVYSRAVTAYVWTTETVGNYRFGPLTLRASAARPDVEDPTRIAWIGCRGDPANGVYSPRAMSAGLPPEQPLPEAVTETTLAQAAANVVVLRPSCESATAALQAAINARFQPTVTIADRSVFVAKPPG